MAVKDKIQMRYNVVQANVQEGPYPNEKWYARVKRNGTLSLRGLANHIAEHGSIYTLDVIYGVLVKFSTCMKELIEQGVAVKLDTLGTFYPSFESEGATSAEDYDITTMLKGVHLRFLPESSATDNITSRELMKKMSFTREADIDKHKKVVRYYQYTPGDGEDDGGGGNG